MPTFDDTHKTLRCGVRDLTEGDGEALSLSGGLRAARARAGHQAHQAASAAAQAAGPGNKVSTETTVRWEFEGPAGWRIALEGRIDLLIETASGLEVIEFKSTFLSGDALAAIPPIASHREQCGYYCLMLLRTGRRVRAGRLRYLSLTDSTQRDIDIGFEPAAVEARLRSRLDTLFAGHRQTLDRARRKRELAATLTFPFATRRAGQTTMIERVTAAAEQGGTLFCSAPTGIGKTVAALFPMVRAALAGDRRLFFVTAKVSQQELAIETLRRIVSPRRGVCAMQLMAKERSCPAAEMRCDPQECPFLADFRLRLERSGMLDHLEALGTVDGGAIRDAAVDAQLCPFEVSLALTQRAAVMVSDYNYVFDPRVALKSFFDEPDAPPMLLVVDEAHNLPERVRGYYSPTLDGAELRRLAELCKPLNSPVYAAMADLLTETGEAVDRQIAAWREAQGERRPVWIGEPHRQFFIQMTERAEIVTLEYLVYLRNRSRRQPPAGLEPEPQGGSRRFRDPLLSACFAIRDYGDCCRHDPDRFAGLGYPDGTTRIWCLDPAPFLRERLDYFQGTVLMSATLSPTDFFLRMTGLTDAGVDIIDLPSPFPRRNRLIAAVPTVDTRYRQRDRSAPLIADIMQRVLRLRPGNYLAFFPSFAFRDQVVAALPPGPYRPVIQSPAMDTAAVLAELESNMVETILVCAVQGGVFAEGVDYPGHLAVGAFIIGPGLPRVCPEQELIRVYHDREDGNGFRHAYMYPGLNRVVQAGGRIIRRESDRGFVILLDRRLAAEGYRRKMPGYWRDEMRVTSDPVALVRDFWQHDGGHSLSESSSGS